MKRTRAMIVSILLVALVLFTGCGSAKDDTSTRIGSLKGPTSLGLLNLMENVEASSLESPDKAVFEFTTEGTADALTGPFINGDLDIILVPANVASILYNKTGGEVVALDINTLGVLYILSSDASIQSIQDLSGRTIVMTGKGTTPDYVLQYLLAANGMSTSDVTLEFKSEATEVTAYLQENPDCVALLPQPYVTTVLMQNPEMAINLDLTKEWDKTQTDKPSKSRLITGVTIVRKAFLNEHPQAIERFVTAHLDSVNYALNNPDIAAHLAVEYGIIPKEEVALAALPYCNICCITGSELKDALSGYLSALYELDPSSIGGSLPGDDFYY